MARGVCERRVPSFRSSKVKGPVYIPESSSCTIPAMLGGGAIAGLALNFIHLDPIKALFNAAVINGILAAAPVMAQMMLLTQNRK